MTRIVSELYNQLYIPHCLQAEMASFIMQYRPDFLENHGTEEHPLVLKHIFILDDPRDFNDFFEAAASILPENWHIYDTSGIFEPIINPMDTMLWMAQLILWGAITAKITLLSLVITLYLRDRKQEIGIYLALGEKKRKVLFKIIIEVISISVTAITIALFSGNYLSRSIS